ncbi:MAG: arylamine N-acetyltransferase [Pseudonocardia sp.]
MQGQNLLLHHALDALAYAPPGSRRVLCGRPPEAPKPARDHMLLRVDLSEGPHIVDVGFGGFTPHRRTRPVPHQFIGVRVTPPAS